MGVSRSAVVIDFPTILKGSHAVLYNFMCLYFLKGSSGYVKIGRTTNFDKRLSEIRRATTDSQVDVLAVFHGEDDFIIERERELHFSLAGSRYKGEWYEDSGPVREALASCDREFNPELLVSR